MKPKKQKCQISLEDLIELLEEVIETRPEDLKKFSKTVFQQLLYNSGFFRRVKLRIRKQKTKRGF